MIRSHLYFLSEPLTNRYSRKWSSMVNFADRFQYMSEESSYQEQESLIINYSFREKMCKDGSALTILKNAWLVNLDSFLNCLCRYSALIRFMILIWLFLSAEKNIKTFWHNFTIFNNITIWQRKIKIFSKKRKVNGGLY